MKKLLLILLCLTFIFSCKDSSKNTKDSSKNTIEERNSDDTLRDFLFQAINNADKELMQTYVDLINFEITYDQISVKDADPSSPSYSFDTIAYISPYLCIYVKSGQYYLYSHRGEHLSLPGLKKHKNGITKHKEWMFYNEDYELYYQWKDTLTVFKVYKFNTSRSSALSKSHIGDRTYIGHGKLEKKTNRKVWKDHLTVTQNVQFYGNNAYTTDVQISSLNFQKKIFETYTPLEQSEFINIIPEVIASGIYWKTQDVIGWSNTGLFAYRNVGEDDGIGEYDYINIINLSNGQRIDGMGVEGESLTNDENIVDTFLLKYNIQHFYNPILFNLNDIKHIPCVKGFLSLENENYKLLGYYKSPFDNKIAINMQIRQEENGGPDMDGNINYIYTNEYYECILE